MSDLRIFFGKYIGTPIKELPSGYLLFLIEECELTEHMVREAAKEELYYRLELSFEPKSERELELEGTLKLSTNQVDKLLKQIDLLEKCLIMSSCFGMTRINIDGYMSNPKLLEQHLEMIRETNQRQDA